MYGQAFFDDDGMGALGLVDEVEPEYQPRNTTIQAYQAGADPQFLADVDTLNEVGYGAPRTNPWDPNVQAAIKAFQGDVYPDAGPVDGLFGPKTRAAMARQLAKRAAYVPEPAAPVAPYVPELPAAPAAPAALVVDPPIPRPADVAPVVAEQKNRTMMYVGFGALALLVVGGVYYATAD